MVEKIEWYREVLELEPNSKVFFPLAKLLVNNNETAKAIEVLEQGLERHPDFMEARLFLIELMYKNGQQEACSKQIARLSKMFAGYAGFWQAWAVCLASEPGEEDTASIIRFLAAHFLVGPIKISEALDLGLAQIVKNHQKETSQQHMAQAEKSQIQPPVQEAKTTATPEPQVEISIPHTGAAVDLESLPDPASENMTTETVEVSSETQAGDIKWEQEVSIPEQEEVIDALETISISGQDIPTPEETPITISEPVTLLPEEDLQNQEENVQTEGQGEASASLSVRTRSMAEVLAEQGDYKEAIEIYQELMTSEKNAKELKNMKKRLAELKKLAAINPEPEEEPAPVHNKERLLGILESLARGVQARINN